MLQIVAETTDDQLTTTGALKAVLGIAATSTVYDAALDLVISAASAWAQTYVGYPLVARGYRETVAGYGSRNLMLSRTPLRAVSAVYYGTDTGVASRLQSTEFAVDSGAGFVSRDQGFEWSVPAVLDLELRPQPGQEYAPWLVDYVAGFTYGGIDAASALYSTAKGTTSTGRTLPMDIERAVLLKAKRMQLGDDYSGPVSAKAVGDLRIQYASGGASGRAGGSGFKDPSEALLDSYRRYM